MFVRFGTTWWTKGEQDKAYHSIKFFPFCLHWSCSPSTCHVWGGATPIQKKWIKPGSLLPRDIIIQWCTINDYLAWYKIIPFFVLMYQLWIIKDHVFELKKPPVVLATWQWQRKETKASRTKDKNAGTDPFGSMKFTHNFRDKLCRLGLPGAPKPLVALAYTEDTPKYLQGGGIM